MDSLQDLIDFNNRTREMVDAQANGQQQQTDQDNEALLEQERARGNANQQQQGQSPGLSALSKMMPTGAASTITAAPGVSLAGGGAATSGVGMGGSLGAFAEGTGGAGTAVAGGGGAAAGGSAAAGGGGSAVAAGGVALWPFAVAAAAIGNEWYSKAHGERRDGADYYKDLATGRVLQQDVDNRWSPMFFGKNDNTGLGHDMSVGADLGSFQPGKAFKDLKKSSLLTGFGLFK